MSFDVIPATLDQQSILANLMQLYIHDFSDFHPVPLGSDGRFGYPQLSFYWKQPHHHPFLIFVDAKLAGFVLIKRGSEIAGSQDVWDMTEFFIIRSHRRRGIGSKAASRIWSLFPGPWRVRVKQSNLDALHFWQSAIDRFTGQPTSPTLVPTGSGECYLFLFRRKQKRRQIAAARRKD